MAGSEEIWLVEDGSNIKVISKDSKTFVQNDAAVYYKRTGLQTIAQEAGVLPGPSGARNVRKDSSMYQMIALPMSPARAGANGASAMQAYNTPQRIAARSPRVIATPVVGLTNWSPSPRGKRNFDMDSDYSDGKRRRGGERNGKGLRQFAMLVCEKVQRKGSTTYNEVADELVAEFADPTCSSPEGYDHKNIRRRVYDALNVLMAMNIISKEKKEIRWIGLPTNSEQECTIMEAEKKRRQERVNGKLHQLQELLLQQIAFKHLVDRNRTSERETGGPPAPNTIIQLPYIVVHTDKKTVIDCSISSDKTEYLFNFDNPFEIHDDIEVLKRMGMTMGLDNGQCGQEDVKKALRMVPEALEHYVLQLAKGVRNIDSLGLARNDAGTSSRSNTQARGGLRKLDGSPIVVAPGSRSYDSLDSEVARVMRGTSVSRASNYSASYRESLEDDYSDDYDDEDEEDN